MVLYELWARSDPDIMEMQINTVRGLMYKVQAVRSIGKQARATTWLSPTTCFSKA